MRFATYGYLLRSLRDQEDVGHDKLAHARLLPAAAPQPTIADAIGGGFVGPLNLKTFSTFGIRSQSPSYSLRNFVDEEYLHRAVLKTNMEIHPSKGLVLIWMVQHGGYRGDGATAQGEFKNWGIKRHAK